ncbi:MAG: response regulator [Rhodospirillales bacterium]|jgi:DNA-binding response OmpR family regulator|nr:response regulator [Rhodospirillales bacterium]
MLKILIAEDDLMIADMTEEVLVSNGYEVCGIARTVDEAVTLARLHKPDLALIDMRLADGELGTRIAAELKHLTKLGVLYASGNMPHVMLTADNGHACLSKPYRPSDLLRGLEIVTDLVDTGRSTTPLPRGFQILQGVIGAPREFPKR